MNLVRHTAQALTALTQRLEHEEVKVDESSEIILRYVVWALEDLSLCIPSSFRKPLLMKLSSLSGVRPLSA